MLSDGESPSFRILPLHDCPIREDPFIDIGSSISRERQIDLTVRMSSYADVASKISCQSFPLEGNLRRREEFHTDIDLRWLPLLDRS